ncbi:hypothetical protein FB107DRAFT_278855 [Schizophyllum commune]
MFSRTYGLPLAQSSTCRHAITASDLVGPHEDADDVAPAEERSRSSQSHTCKTNLLEDTHLPLVLDFTRAADILAETDTQNLQAFFRRPSAGILRLPTYTGANLRADRTLTIQISLRCRWCIDTCSLRSMYMFYLESINAIAFLSLPVYASLQVLFKTVIWFSTTDGIQGDYTIDVARVDYPTDGRRVDYTTDGQRGPPYPTRPLPATREDSIC